MGQSIKTQYLHSTKRTMAFLLAIAVALCLLPGGLARPSQARAADYDGIYKAASYDDMMDAIVEARAEEKNNIVIYITQDINTWGGMIEFQHFSKVTLRSGKEEYAGEATNVVPSDETFTLTHNSGGDRHFEVRGTEVTIENLVLTGGVGGGVLVTGGDVGYPKILARSGDPVWQSGRLNLVNSTIENCEAEYGGGVELDGGILNLTNSVIESNQADYGGGVAAHQDGNFLSMSASSEIKGNTATYGGGVAVVRQPSDDDSYNGGSLVVSGSGTVGGNSADIQGGGVYIEGTGNLADVSISGNSAIEGGGVFVHNLDDGQSYNRSSVSLERASVTNNNANAGGGVYNMANLTMDGASVSSNKSGGGIYNTGRLEAKASAISGNVNSGNGGGIINMSEYAVDDMAGDSRSGVFLYSTTISNNTSGGYGGGVYAGHDSFTRHVEGSGNAYTGNKAVKGGAVYIDAAAVYNMQTLTVSGNSATYGGGIYVAGYDDNHSQPTVSGLKVRNNTAGEDGGGIYVESGSIYAQDTVFESNGATAGTGGAIYTREYEYVTVGGGSSFTQNTGTNPVYTPDAASIEYHNQLIEDGTSFSDGFDYAYNNYDINYLGDGNVTPPDTDLPSIDRIVAEPNVLQSDEGKTTLTIYGSKLNLFDTLDLRAVYENGESDEVALEYYDPDTSLSEISYEWTGIPENLSEVNEVHFFEVRGYYAEYKEVTIELPGDNPDDPDDPPKYEQSTELIEVNAQKDTTVTVLPASSLAPSIKSLTPDRNSLSHEGGNVELTIDGENLNLYSTLQIRSVDTNETESVEGSITSDNAQASASFSLPGNGTDKAAEYVFEAVANGNVEATAKVTVRPQGSDPEDPDPVDPEDPDPVDPDPVDPDPVDPDPVDPDPVDPDPVDPDPVDPDPVDPDPVDPEYPEEPGPGGEKEYRGGGSGGGFHGGGQYWRGPAIFDILEHQATMSVEDYLNTWNEGGTPDAPTVAVENAGYLTAEQLLRAASGAREAKGNARGPDVTLQLDTTMQTEAGLELQGRIFLNPEGISEGVYTGVYVQGEDVNRTKNIFTSRFGLSNAAVVSLQQREGFGQKLEIAANVDLTGLNTDNLYLYSYDPYTGEYQQLQGADAYVDTAGFLHFSTDQGGDIVVVDQPLGSASGQLSGVVLKKEDPRLDVKEPEEEPGKDLDFGKNEED